MARFWRPTAFIERKEWFQKSHSCRKNCLFPSCSRASSIVANDGAQNAVLRRPEPADPFPSRDSPNILAEHGPVLCHWRFRYETASLRPSPWRQRRERLFQRGEIKRTPDLGLWPALLRPKLLLQRVLQIPNSKSQTINIWSGLRQIVSRDRLTRAKGPAQHTLTLPASRKSGRWFRFLCGSWGCGTSHWGRGDCRRAARSPS
jgi:hypothetical protein